MHRLAKFIYFRVLGWKLKGFFPNVNKCVVIVIPHTHWLDFFLGLLIRKVVNQEINYIGKKGLFKPPFGWFFRWTGGAPVDRSKNSNTVDNIVQIFNSRKIFRLALAPEGTRKKVEHLRTGFYHIAKKAKVPILMVAFDFGKKEIKIGGPFYTTDDQESDFEKIIPLLARNRKVVAMELQAHGRTGDRNSGLTFAQDANGVAALLKNLQIEKLTFLVLAMGDHYTANSHPAPWDSK